MKWFRHTVVVYLRRDEVVVELVKGGVGEVVKRFERKGKLKDIMAVIKKEYGDEVRMVVDDDMMYVTGWFEDETMVDKEHVRQQAELYIPEHLDSVLWDWERVNSKRGLGVQVVAFGKKLGDELTECQTELGLNLDVVVPLSVVLRDGLKKLGETTLVMYGIGESGILALVDGGLVVLSKRIGHEEVVSVIEELQQWCSESLDKDVGEVVVGGDWQLQAEEVAGLKLRAVDMNVGVWMAERKAVEESDKVIDVLVRKV